MVECEVRDSLRVFFIPIISTDSRRLICLGCNEDYALPVTS